MVDYSHVCLTLFATRSWVEKNILNNECLFFGSSFYSYSFAPNKNNCPQLVEHTWQWCHNSTNGETAKMAKIDQIVQKFFNRIIKTEHCDLYNFYLCKNHQNSCKIASKCRP